MSVRECVRCMARTKNGQRCKRRTCVYAKYCSQHARSILGLYLAKSGIPNSGRGLFTSRQIEKNSRICDYTGLLMNLNDYINDKSYYGISITKDLILDARSTQSALGRYTNHCRNTNRNNGHCRGNNARFKINRRNRTVCVQSIKRIYAGNEVFVAYGKGYWS